MNKNNELRVFISSTFRDLQEEREHLVKKIFPEIRALCRARGITFTEVDLRWGLTEEEATLGRIIRTCLEEIDKCRPYFIGMIGDRYGWIPELHELMMDPELLQKYPWIEDAAIEEASATEMEFIHGAFNAPGVDGQCVYFYRRDVDLSTSDEPGKLQRLIERAEKIGRPMRAFTTVEALGAMIHDDLLSIIEKTWPDAEPPSPLELERRSHAAFASSRRRAYIVQPEHVKRFNEWVDFGLPILDFRLKEQSIPPIENPKSKIENCLVITGESGLGKSSLVAYLVEQYRRKNPTAFIIEHFVGASQQSGTASAIMRHVVEEIRERFAIEEEPAKEEQLERDFANWLYRAEHLATQHDISMLIALDAVNQLDERGRRLAWLPKTIPSNIRLLVSTTPGESHEQLRACGWRELELAPLEDERLRLSIVVRYLAEFHKSISASQLQRITSDDKARSPLYLRVIAEELRLHGEHETLSEVIDRYRSAEELDDVFQRVLARMELDYGVELIEPLLALLWTSQGGLSEQELLELTGSSRLELSQMLFALDYHLIQRDGLLGFFHNYLRRAVEKRYLPSEETKRQCHLRLAEYFQRQTAGARVSRELIWQLHQAQQFDALVDALTTIEHLMVLYQGETQWEVLRYWATLAEQYDLEHAHHRALERWRSQPEHDVKESVVLGRIASLLEATGRWDAAIDVQRERLALTIAEGDRVREARTRRSIGQVLRMQGAYDQALQELAAAVTLFEELGDQHGLSRAIGNIGVIYSNRGDFDRALERFLQKEAICRKIGDHAGLAAAIGNMAIVYFHRGEYDRALACHQQTEMMCREMGDRHGVSLTSGGMGNVHYYRGEYDRALECYQQQEMICREIGDRGGIADAVANTGAVYFSRQQYEQAIECFRQQEIICREIGDRSGIVAAIGNMGAIYYYRGEFDRAIECFIQQRDGYVESGDSHGHSIAVGNMGAVYYNRSEYEQALKCFTTAADGHRAIGFRHGVAEWLASSARVLLAILFEGELPPWLEHYIQPLEPDGVINLANTYASECVAISRELGRSDTLFEGEMLLARIEAVNGRRDLAMQRLYGMLNEAIEDDHRAELHYWLWRVGRTEGGGQRTEEDRREALRAYEALYATTLKYEYGERIDELNAAGELP